MRLFFSAAIAIVLLAIYVGLVWYGITISLCVAEGDTCSGPKAEAFNKSMQDTLALIGGLVSALVISELAVTKKGEIPAARMVAPQATLTMKRSVQFVTAAYLTVWLVAGFAVFLFGYLFSSEVTGLAALGQAWIGIAVGAAYSYFGIEQ